MRSNTKLYKSNKVKVPTMLQMEALECGAASLGMILAYYGRYVPLEILREECGVSRDGSKAGNILKAARKYGLIAKGFRYEPKQLKDKRFPMIVHWNFNHFVVLEGFKKDKVFLNDPAVGPRVVSYEEFDRCFTGVAIQFEPGETFCPGGLRPNIIRALAHRFRGAEVGLAFAVIAGVALVIPGLIIPIFSRIFVDNILLDGRRNWLLPLMLGMAITASIRAVLTWLQKYYLLRLETKIALNTSAGFLSHVLRLPVVFFTQRSSGDISTRMMSNNTVAGLLSRDLASGFLNVILVIFYLALMGMYDIGLTMVSLGFAFVSVFMLKLVSKKRQIQNAKMLQDWGKLQGTSMSGLQSIETLKATGSESDFFSRWAGYHSKILSGIQELSLSTQTLTSVPLLLTDLSTAFVLLAGSYKVLNGDMTVGMLVAFQSLLQSFMTPINQLVAIGGKLQEAQGDMQRLDDVENYPVDKQLSKSETEAVGKLAGNIELIGVSFGYSKLEPPLIEDFNLTMKVGDRVAIVGGSGSGKSTVAKLISGLYKPWSGKILFDGVERDEISSQIMYNSFAVVDQDICMFEGSIKDNIALWDKTIAEPEVVKAAMDACIHNDISLRNGGYRSSMEEGGRNFSGGQRQRLELARALVGNPSILLLDEATSALDPRTEEIIGENIKKRECTCIIIAHRLSTIRDCDEIIVMDKGRIVMRGKHDEMKDAEGPYAQLIKMQ